MNKTKILPIFIAIFTFKAYASVEIIPKISLESQEIKIGGVAKIIADFDINICNHHRNANFYLVESSLSINDKEVTKQCKLIVGGRSCILQA